MLEILLLIWLGRKIAAMAREKGRGPTGYVFMLVGLWVGGEICGMIVGSMLSPGRPGDFNGMAYIFALIGAAAGATATFLIVRSLSPLGAMSGARGFPMSAPGMPYQPPGTMPPPPRT